MTANSELILNFLKKNFGKEFTKQEIVAELGVSLPAVTGSINGLIKKGKNAGVDYVTTRTEEIEVEPATETRKAKMKTISYHTLTEAGLAYDPVAEEAVKQAAKEAAKAEREAAKAAKKAAAAE